ncbi:MAG: Ig-like domain-containing protein, partial [Bacteroidota bacterium]
PDTLYLLHGQTYDLQAFVQPVIATDHRIQWISGTSSVAGVNSVGMVAASQLGSSLITATTVDGGGQDSTLVLVVDSLPEIAVANLLLEPETFTLGPTTELQMQATVLPAQASDPGITWTVLDSNVVRIDSNGLVQGILEGTTQVIASADNGQVADTSTLTVEVNFGTFTSCLFLQDEFASATEYDIPLSYSTGYASTLVMELVDANSTVIGSGEVAVLPGLSSVDVPVSCPIAPAPGNDYSLQVRIEVAEVDSVLFSCVQSPVSIFPATAIESPTAWDVSFYPNPSEGKVEVELTGIAGEVKLRLWDVQGKLIQVEALNASKTSLQLQHLPKGMYLVQLIGEQGQLTRRLQLH